MIAESRLTHRLHYAAWRAPLWGVLFFLFYFVMGVWGWSQFGGKINPLAVVAYPFCAIVVGIPLAYLLTWSVWMPAMHWLARRGAYRLANVMGAGVLMSIAFVLVVEVFFVQSPSAPIAVWLKLFIMFVILFMPPTMTAAYLFFRFSVRRGAGRLPSPLRAGRRVC